MWREELRVRDVVFWEESGKQEFNLCKMLETKDRSMKAALESIDIGWLNSLQHCKDSLRLTTQKLINKKSTLESIGKRQRELVKGNALRLGQEDSARQDESVTAKHPDL